MPESSASGRWKVEPASRMFVAVAGSAWQSEAVAAAAAAAGRSMAAPSSSVLRTMESSQDSLGWRRRTSLEPDSLHNTEQERTKRVLVEGSNPESASSPRLP